MEKQFNMPGSMAGNSSIDFKKYIKLFKRKKFLIFAVFSIVFFLTLIIVYQISPKPEYTATALLQFSDKRNLAGEDSRGRPENESKIGMLRSRIFLTEVSQKLAYPIQFGDIERSQVVDSVYLDSKFETGEFTIEKNNDILRLYYSNESKNIDQKQVLELKTLSNPVKFGGFEIYFNPKFWEKNNALEFAITKMANSVENILKNLEFNFLNRSNTLLELSYKGTDPIYISETLNTIVDEFLKKNLDFKKFATREVVSILSEQLQTARQELDSADSELKTFREKNPWIGLSADASGALANVSSYESQKLTIENKKVELSLLLKRYQSASGDNKYLILNEVLSYLSAQALPTIPALTSEFLTLTSERTRLKSSYAEGHPILNENTLKLQNLEEKVLLTANKQIQDYNSQIQNVSQNINEQSYKIRSLPAKELRFAELQRKRNVADQVYSSLLVRYNQAKVADAVEVGDIIVLDNAVPPQREGALLLYLRLLAISLVAGLVAGFGVVFVGDFLDKTVRSSEELEKIISLKVISKIPVIGSEKDVPEDVFEKNKRVDPKLVTTDYSPTPMGEAYRSLRTQLLFGKDNENINSIFITSLNANEGKSLNAGNLAITFAQQKIPTLLVDADLRRGVLHNSFACNKKPGLSDFLYSSSDINDENIRKIIQQTHVPNLHLISSGMPIPNPSEILGSQRAKDIIKFLKDRFGFVIFDTPPISITVDSVIISKNVDTGIFVVRSGKTNVENVKEKISEYADFKNRLFGIILNCAELEIEKNKYTYSYYNY